MSPDPWKFPSGSSPLPQAPPAMRPVAPALLLVDRGSGQLSGEELTLELMVPPGEALGGAAEGPAGPLLPGPGPSPPAWVRHCLSVARRERAEGGTDPGRAVPADGTSLRPGLAGGTSTALCRDMEAQRRRGACLDSPAHNSAKPGGVSRSVRPRPPGSPHSTRKGRTEMAS